MGLLPQPLNEGMESTVKHRGWWIGTSHVASASLAVAIVFATCAMAQASISAANDRSAQTTNTTELLDEVAEVRKKLARPGLVAGIEMTAEKAIAGITAWLFSLVRRDLR